MVYSILHILLLSRKMLPFWPGSVVVNDYATRKKITRSRRGIWVNWASEASPTLGCSIEISRDIYMSVCLSCPIMRRRNYVRACSKSVLGQ